ncbi:TonB-dependent receptor [Tamlana sp. 2_MG-2023]|uniref:TonB-dependent receptor domain-containing protein n=1 Tax=unclassified Tamlana TaxID=2614803 RepID=UPI0026E1CA27|nr:MULTISPECIES: TonB-dependent receptor [unclassified Tamlana]MDO6758809.1 TonB-dependent receptor [Tamlana sp. 2_MG-2023]MDO6789508.1 TonB-dependent receptor [Tamlana sp. 1_MG-2023]
MTLKAYKLIFSLIFSISLYAQNPVNGVVVFSKTQKPVADVQVYDKASGEMAVSDVIGHFSFQTAKKELTLVFFSFEYETQEITINTSEAENLKIELHDLTTKLSEVEITARKEKIFEMQRLNDVEETAIYAGKKTEVVLVDQSMANLASNNARQIFSQVAGLNIYQNDDAGLQLNVGGRGLDPNRTANFNTRQNGYDISADVLGYPESYYTPASEGLAEIQVIRGAASLQYGTQFGGLINFKMKEPNPNKPIEVITRNTVGSFGLYTNFTSLSGTKDKWSYYSYFNYKKGDGFRPNSEFESKNVFAQIGYQFNNKTALTGDVSYLHYLAQQAGGLTDDMFEEDPLQSNRERNWFKVNWLLYNLKLAHEFTENTNFTFNFFGLQASRKALGFRTNRVNQADPGGVRDLIVGDFNNFGFESRLLSKYQISDKDATFLIGTKFYKANNFQEQGPGSDGIGPDFDVATDDFPYYTNQSQFDLPNFNVSVFGENIFYVTDKFSVTPGFRFEYIKTQSDGYYKNFNLDNAGNVIFEETVEEDQNYERAFVLLGLGLSYKANANLEFYGNISQNYRSVTFSDINVTNPAFTINPDISDESGFTADMGIRGTYKSFLSYDLGVFGLFYKDRIGFVQTVLPDGRIVAERGNIGDAVMYGVESLFDFNLKSIVGLNSDFKLNYFINTSIIASEYTHSEQLGVQGNKVEFVPDLNLKTGLRGGYKNVLGSIQYTYLGSQFTDATNSVTPSLSGVIGEIPAYDVLDISLSYSYKRFKLETGLNNVLDNSYFTRRATGYPGPGIIPSAPRNWYATLEIKI